MNHNAKKIYFHRKNSILSLEDTLMFVWSKTN